MRKIDNWIARRSGARITIDGVEAGAPVKISGVDEIFVDGGGRVIARSWCGDVSVEIVLCIQAAAPVWPAEITLELNHILGTMNFVSGPIAHVYQAAGYPVRTRCEDEQAFILHRLIGFWFAHGGDWATAAQADLDAVRASIPAKTKS